MRCSTCRDVVSARLDGEAHPADGPDADHHLTSCAACTAWARTVSGLAATTRVRAAESVPDLSVPILAARRAATGPTVPVTRPGPGPLPDPTPSRSLATLGAARYALGVVAVTKLILASQVLLGGVDDAALHTGRELGAFDLALAVGLLVAALQPERAWGLLPLAGCLAAVLAVTAVADVLGGRSLVGHEAGHVIEVVGVALLWLVARASGTRARPLVRRPLVARPT